MPLAPCLVCGKPSPGPYCAEHARQTYDAEYQANRRIVLANATHCWICGGPPTADDQLTCDHILSLDQGGTNDIDNLMPAHLSCNSRRGATEG